MYLEKQINKCFMVLPITYLLYVHLIYFNVSPNLSLYFQFNIPLFYVFFKGLSGSSLWCGVSRLWRPDWSGKMRHYRDEPPDPTGLDVLLERSVLHGSLVAHHGENCTQGHAEEHSWRRYMDMHGGRWQGVLPLCTSVFIFL